MKKILSGGGSSERVFLSPPHMGSRERQYLLEAFDSNWIAPVGPALLKFEEELADWMGRPEVVALNSGTAALHLALLVAGIGVGDTVVAPTMTFAATINAIRYVQADPIFVDSEPSTMNIDPELLGELLSTLADQGRLPKAVVVVDLYGQAARYEEILPICARYEIPLIEDSAEALGASRAGKPCGSFGQYSIMSFNGNKIATTSGGGALAATDLERLSHARYLSTQARQPVAHYEHEHIGYNYRLSNLLAGIGRAQLEWLGERIELKRQVRQRYLDAFAGIEGISISGIDPNNNANCWLTTMQVDRDLGLTPTDFMKALDDVNIETRPLWKPMHQQPVFRSCANLLNGTADRLFRTGLCLPSGSSLTESQQERVVVAVRSVLSSRPSACGS